MRKTKAKHAGGRHPLPPDRKLVRVEAFYLLPAERAKLEAEASAREIPLTRWVVAILRDHLRRSGGSTSGKSGSAD